MINLADLRAKMEEAIRQYEHAIAEFDAFLKENGLSEEFAAFVERTGRNIEEKKMIQANHKNGSEAEKDGDGRKEKRRYVR